jgi:hypothetical protein
MRTMLFEVDPTKLSRASATMKERSETKQGKSERANTRRKRKRQVEFKPPFTIHESPSLHVHSSQFEVAPQLVAYDLASRFRVPALFTSGPCSQIVYCVHDVSPTQNYNNESTRVRENERKEDKITRKRAIPRVRISTSRPTAFLHHDASALGVNGPPKGPPQGRPFLRYVYTSVTPVEDALQAFCDLICCEVVLNASCASPGAISPHVLLP